MRFHPGTFGKSPACRYCVAISSFGILLSMFLPLRKLLRYVAGCLEWQFVGGCDEQHVAQRAALMSDSEDDERRSEKKKKKRKKNDEQYKKI